LPPGLDVLKVAFVVTIVVFFSSTLPPATRAQDTVTGAFEGTISDSQTGTALKGALVEIINQQTNVVISLRADYRGRFYQGLLLPGIYRIRVSSPGYRTHEVLQRLKITYTGEVVPVPVALDPAPAGVVTLPAPAPVLSDTDIRASIITVDARRSGSFPAEEITSLPLGGTTLARTFDELALLLPGVAPPPQTLGSVAGPGVGAGVGSAGQFSVNGLRSRGNNFTVDGSDNNDEDIGVRRQGFVALIPQPIESVQEYQVITLLAPAQFGRNLGGQVNAVSKSGGDETHGTISGMFNSSQLNARNAFDTTFGNSATDLRTLTGQPVLLNGAPIVVRNQSGGEDSFTFVQGGFVLGGPLQKTRMFYFVSAEGQLINASEEKSFTVPTLEQRGVFRSGATGLFRDPFTGAAVATVPSSRNGAALFNLFPFPNSPNGVYGVNTYTELLPADARGAVASARWDRNFDYRGRPQSVTARYNFTQDRRIVPVTGGALFSSLQPRVRTQNLSVYANSKISGKDATPLMFDQLRLSYGRTRLVFDEVRDGFLLPSASLPNEPFLLNAASRLNITQPAAPGIPNTGTVSFISPLPTGSATRFVTSVEQELGLLGQVAVAGFSPLGVDVFNFPQRRVNNTYQIADDFSIKTARHNFVIGLDIRRSELNSDLPRNARSLATFNSAPRLILENGVLRFPTAGDANPIVRGEDLAALGAASNFFLTLNRTGGDDAHINLRYYQLNFFGQDTWRISPRLSVGYGLRYEYNTPVREMHQLIESTFNDPALALAPGLALFIAGRTSIFEPDRNNFAPRVGFAYAPRRSGNHKLLVVRGGYGLFYDQILGAVASQSRNVYPTFINLNFGGVAAAGSDNLLVFFNPGNTSFMGIPLQTPGTLNQYNPALPLPTFLNSINTLFPRALGATLPSRILNTPLAHHYTFGMEQQINNSLVIAASYVGTTGRHLLRFTTPNLGPGITVAPTSLTSFIVPDGGLNLPTPIFLGRSVNPVRPVNTIGTINRFETTANSQYNSLQIQLRGQLRRAGQFQVSYTLSNARDDVSDVFDLAGAFVLPQDSLTLAGEYGPSNFDVRHRLTYNLIVDLTAIGTRYPGLRWLVRDMQFSSMGRYTSGQPFTVNSSIDVNLDGNLTDRLNTMNGLVVTGDRRQPLRLTTNNTLSLLAPFGQDGAIGRNTFRAGSILEWDAALTRAFKINKSQRVLLRLELFNLLNRDNFGVPVRILEAPAFGQAVSTVTPPRRLQVAVKYVF